jgi:sphingomyelin phosphodiesterase 2
MRSAYAQGHIVLAMGDFNMIPLSLAHQIVEKHGRASDIWRIKHPDSSIGAAVDDVEIARERPIPSAEYNLEENGATCDSILNTWRWSKQQQKKLEKGETIKVDVLAEDPRAKRLDYVFLGDALGEYSVQDVKVGMTMRHPSLKCSLSDHFSVEAVISRSKTGTFTNQPQQLYDAVSKGDLDRPSYLNIQTYNLILAMVAKYTTRERKQRRYRLAHFIGELTVAIGCLVAVWWSPRNYVSFLLMLLSTLGLVAGVVDGLIGGLFVGSEIRALKEFQWEIENAKDAASVAKRWERIPDKVDSKVMA